MKKTKEKEKVFNTHTPVISKLATPFFSSEKRNKMKKKKQQEKKLQKFR